MPGETCRATFSQPTPISGPHRTLRQPMNAENRSTTFWFQANGYACERPSCRNADALPLRSPKNDHSPAVILSSYSSNKLPWKKKTPPRIRFRGGAVKNINNVILATERALANAIHLREISARQTAAPTMLARQPTTDQQNAALHCGVMDQSPQQPHADLNAETLQQQT